MGNTAAKRDSRSAERKISRIGKVERNPIIQSPEDRQIASLAIEKSAKSSMELAKECNCRDIRNNKPKTCSIYLDSDCPAESEKLRGGRSCSAPTKKHHTDQKSAHFTTNPQNPAKGSKKELRLTPAQKTVIREGWDASTRGEVGSRVYNRLFQQRPDIKRAYEQISAAQPEADWVLEAQYFTDFITTLVENIDNPAVIQHTCWQRGAWYASLREYGFKPQFWVPMSEIMTTEFLYLDRGLNPVANVVNAWAALLTLMFRYMRDGFYDELRSHRRAGKRRVLERARSVPAFGACALDGYSFTDQNDDSTDETQTGRNERKISDTSLMVSDSVYRSVSCGNTPRGGDQDDTLPSPATLANDSGNLAAEVGDKFTTPPTSPAPNYHMKGNRRRLAVIQDVNENLP